VQALTQMVDGLAARQYSKVNQRSISANSPVNQRYM
jgi:hypothetical protein